MYIQRHYKPIDNEKQESNLGFQYSAHSIFLLNFSSELRVDNKPFQDKFYTSQGVIQLFTSQTN